jgi:hypothetical protein
VVVLTVATLNRLFLCGLLEKQALSQCQEIPQFFFITPRFSTPVKSIFSA